MKLLLYFLCLLLAGSAQAMPLGPELVSNGGFESSRTVGWSVDVGWGLDGPPHTGARSAYTVYPLLGPAYWEQVLTGLTPGTPYLVSFWVANSPFFGPDPNGIQFDFGSDVYSASDLGEDFQELSFTHVAASRSETIHISGYNQEGAIFLDDVSVREILPAAAPEMDPASLPGAVLLVGLLLVSGRSKS